MRLWCCWKDVDEQDLIEDLFDKIWIWIQNVGDIEKKFK
jgi:hypothetical protein